MQSALLERLDVDHCSVDAPIVAASASRPSPGVTTGVSINRPWPLAWLRAGLIGAALLASQTVAAAETVAPEAGLQETLGAMNVSIYYEPTDAGYEVVTTVSTEQPNSAIRFMAILSPGQETLISVPRSVGLPAIELLVHRVANHLVVSRPIS